MSAAITARKANKEEAGPKRTDVFLICLFRHGEKSKQEASRFLDQFVGTIRARGGRIQLRSDRPQSWSAIDGLDHHVEPHHLAPATFDFNCVVIAGFPDSVDVHGWWSSNELFDLLKWRECMEKIGVFAVDGLQTSIDVQDRQSASFGEKVVLLELMKMQSFKPLQQYVDNYRRFGEECETEMGKLKVNILFSEGVSGVLMNEFELDYACASGWRSKAEANQWYDSEVYQSNLLPQRHDFSKSLAIVLPLFEERLEDLGRAAAAEKGQAITVRLR